MDKDKLLKAIRAVIKKEVAKQIAEMKVEIISEMMRVIDFTERKIMSEVGQPVGQPTKASGTGDLQRVMKNLGTMPVRS